MNNNLFSLAAIILLSLSITSCNDSSKFKDKIEHLEELQVELAKADSVYKNMEKDSALKLMTYMDKTLRLIEQYLPDSLLGSEVEKLYEAKVANKTGTRAYRKVYFIIDNEILNTQNQVSKLIKELKAGKLDTLTATDYYNIEVSNARLIIDGVNQLDLEFSEYPRMINPLKPFLDSLKIEAEKMRYTI
ncbi:MAG: hypothetical protein ACXITV_13270 [Luteibaculaceae bacterium]